MGRPTISFESACAPGNYIRQKNYRFVLGRKGDMNFGKLSSTIEIDLIMVFKAVLTGRQTRLEI